ncbi:hypothetical protein ABDD95_18610 [Mucilaginibacter sp. PAMB04274]|uniref:hypothetical protein n=1 Tax=Mucilaginibacter sp. PAMB04274 TaxID=3138568 RepID=UPI0031F6648A
MIVRSEENTWHDSTIGKIGGVVDFVMLYLKSTNEDDTETDALRWLNNMVVKPGSAKSSNVVLLPGWRISRKDELEDLALIRYLEKRGIPSDLARKTYFEAYVQEVGTGKRMYTLAFENEDEGYSLRNIFMKGTVGPQTVTFKRGEVAKPKAVHLFKDSFDYLSALLRFPQYVSQHDSIVLNSVRHLTAAFPYLVGYGYQTLYSWMDNTERGNNATLAINRFVRTQDGLGHKPMNGLYRAFKDVNDWHVATSEC